MFEPKSRTRSWGFKFLPTDAGAIVLFAGAVLVLWRLGSPLGWILLIAAIHFFLFCNIFRIVRRRELVWAGLFVVNICLWDWFGQLAFLPVLICQLPITAGVLLIEIRSPGYHGIFADRLNSRLKDYLNRGIL